MNQLITTRYREKGERHVDLGAAGREAGVASAIGTHLQTKKGHIQSHTGRFRAGHAEKRRGLTAVTMTEAHWYCRRLLAGLHNTQHKRTRAQQSAAAALERSAEIRTIE